MHPLWWSWLSGRYKRYLRGRLRVTDIQKTGQQTRTFQCEPLDTNAGGQRFVTNQSASLAKLRIIKSKFVLPVLLISP